MGMSPYLSGLRAAVGRDLLLLPAVTAIVFDEARRVLLVHERGTGVWSTPGGAIDPGEHPADAVVRELWEETGLFAEPVRLLGVYAGDENVVTYANGDRSAYVAIVFECHVRDGRLREETEETQGARFMALDDLESYEVSRWARYLLPRLYVDSPPFEPASWKP